MELVYLLFFLSFSFFVKSDNGTFIPTKDWQIVGEGMSEYNLTLDIFEFQNLCVWIFVDQSIPPGLHVRINLTSGLKEAKLLDENEGSSKNTALLSTANSETDKLQNLEEMLKNIPHDSFIENNIDAEKHIQLKFKSYEEIKKEFKSINMSINTDNELIEKLILTYENQTENRHIDLVFEDLMYLMHQIDNALHFISIQGIEKIILPNLKSSKSNMQKHALNLLGTLVNNNPVAQELLIKKNISIYLTAIIGNEELETSTLSSCIFAMGSLLRKHPNAQNEILPQNLESMIKIIDNCSLGLKIRLKMLTLISDLVVEDSDSENNNRKTFELQINLMKLKFCNKVENLVSNNRKDLIKELSFIENVLFALQVNKSICFELWSESSNLRHNLIVLKNTLSRKISIEQDEYLNDLIQTINEVIDHLYKVTKIKEEF